MGAPNSKLNMILNILISILLLTPLCLPAQSVTTNHVAMTTSGEIAYEAHLGFLPIEGARKELLGELFFVSYSKKGCDTTKRPITFCINGGPGSASIWLNIGALGPKKIAVDEVGYPKLPARLEDNIHTLLEVSDLVFIDPISCGFSRVTDEKYKSLFFSTVGDILSLSQFIRLYISKNDRWLSPKYILGESYGTIRAAGIASSLFEDYYIPVDGVMLISPALDYQIVSLQTELSYACHFPTMAATAHYHKKLAYNLLMMPISQFLEEVENFVEQELQPALFAGNALSKAKRDRIARLMAHYSGIDYALFIKHNLMLTPDVFTKELLKDRGINVGWYDSRFVGHSLAPILNWKWYYDPSSEKIFGPFSVSYNHYLRGELGWQGDQDYKIFSDCIHLWDFEANNCYLQKTETLATTLALNSQMRLFVASGYYDHVTPYYGSKYTMRHLPIPPSVQEKVVEKFYTAGHMMYLHQPSQRELTKDLKAFVLGADPLMPK